MTGPEALDDMMNDRCGDGVMQARMFLARAEVARLRRVAEAGVRLHFDKYAQWANAGGENECPHGIGRGLACRKCDIATIRRDALAAALDGGEGK